MKNTSLKYAVGLCVIILQVSNSKVAFCFIASLPCYH